jgi:hypothetical protein
VTDSKPFPTDQTELKELIMKLAIRAFALFVVLAGAAAASLSSSAPSVIPSHQATMASLPIPACGPGVPDCPKDGTQGR